MTTEKTPALEIEITDGTMLPFTSFEFRRLRNAFMQGGWQDANDSQERAAGGPTFVKGPGRITLDPVVVFGLVYWRVRRWNAETASRASRNPMIDAAR